MGSFNAWPRPPVRPVLSLAGVAVGLRGPLCGRSQGSPLKATVRTIKTLRTDVLIVGSGAGGSTTAAALAKAGITVLVAEEGPWIEQGELEPFSIQQMEAQYRNGGLTVALGNPTIAYAEGRCVGGGTEINSGLYHRAPTDVVERWVRQYEIRDLNPDVLNHFSKEIERELTVGPLPLPEIPASRRLLDGAQRLGWDVAEVPRLFRYDVPKTDHHLAGQKQSMTRTHLPTAIRAGARVIPNCRVRRLYRRHNRFVSAAATLDGYPITIEFDRLFLCAGAVQTAALLARSGVRRTRGFPLRVHPTIKLAAYFDDEINVIPDVAVHQIKEFGPDVSFGGSVSRPGFVALALADDWDANRSLANEWKHVAVYYAAIRSQGRGRIRSVPAFDEPLVTYRLLPADKDKLTWSLLRLAELVFESGARRVFPSVAGAASATSLGEIRNLCLNMDASRMNLMSVHLFSSLPMGESDRCLVDSFGRLKGFVNTIVNDASILPDAPGVNPQGTIMALAARNTMRFLADE